MHINSWIPVHRLVAEVEGRSRKASRDMEGRCEARQDVLLSAGTRISGKEVGKREQATLAM